MLLTPQDAQLFFKLHRALLHYVNLRLQLAPSAANAIEFTCSPLPIVIRARDSYLEQPALLEDFIEQNPENFNDSELEIVRSWRQRVAGEFYILRQLKKYAVFLVTDEQPVAYGVVSLTQPIEDISRARLPLLAKAVLLPFKGQIVYDGFLNSYGISFGPGIRSSLNECFQKAKKLQGIVTSLPMPAASASAKKEAAKPKSLRKTATKAKETDAAQTIFGLVEQFCQEHLNDEYAALCRKLTEKLARKRPSPLLSGKPNTWACGIVRTVGWMNFLDDRTQTPHLKLTAIDKAFGVGESTGQGKSMLIRKMFKITPYNFEWLLPSHLDDNSAAWLLSVNGLIMDIRQAPREAQVEAFEKGLIPYIPADRE